MPWLREDLLPEKPADSDYGYLLGKKFHPCTQEELIARCASKDVRVIKLVWYPGAPRVVPVTEVQFLFETIKNKGITDQKRAIGIVIFNVVIWCLLLLTSMRKQGWYLFMLAVFGVIPLCQGLFALKKIRRSVWENASREAFDKRFGIWIEMQRATWSWILLGVTLLVAGGQFLVGAERSYGMAGLDKGATWQGEWWRLLTAPFLHAHPLHLLLNAFSLFFIGKMTEVLSSRYHTALIFLFSALVGSLFSLVLLEGTSVGASGGIMGFIGFLFVLGSRQRLLMPKNYAKSLATSVLLLAGIGIVGATFIDNAAHLGGFLGGLLLGMILIPKLEGNLPLQVSFGVRVAGILSLLLIIGCASMVLYHFIMRT